jgi:hypothetical protein
MKLSLAAGVSIERIEAPSKWNTVLARESSQVLVVDALLADAERVQAVPVDPEVIFTVHARVGSVA